MAMELVGERRMIKPLRIIREKDEWESHDVRLQRMLPMAMGVNRRPYLARPGRGRPTNEHVDDVVKIELTCPAALGNVRCTRWLNPSTDSRDDLPFVDPGPDVPLYRCCKQKTVVITLTADQVQRQQHSQFIPGSWKHAIVYEAERACTEQRFDQVRRRAIVGLEHLKEGGRREPVVALTVAAAFAVVNTLTIQAFEERQRAGTPPKTESIAARWKQLAMGLGHEPAKEPART